MRIFLSVCCWLLAASAFAAEIKIDFTGLATGQAPTNFSSTVAGNGPAGNWTILSAKIPSLLAPLTPQAESMASQLVLAQTSQDPTDEHFPLLVYQGESFKNFKLTTRFKMISGIAEQMAGVVFRYQNASNVYVVRASALGHNVRFYKMVNGQRSDPIGPTVDLSLDKWYQLSVQCTGNQITIWLDDSLVMPPLQDNTFNSGKVGFWTKSDAVSYFNGFTVDYTPEIPAAQSLVNRLLAQQTRLLGLKLYTLNAQGEPRVLASKDPQDIGQPGGKAEKEALTQGTISFGRSPGTVAVWLPLRDRNGDPMASVWVRLTSFFGETQDNAIARATLVIKAMQEEVTSLDDLLK